MANTERENDILRSGFRFYSYGIVTEDKERDSDIIKFWPVEHHPRVNGKLADNAYKRNNELPDINGLVMPEKTVGEDVMTARWIPLSNSNRMSSPDVYENETVMIFQTSDSTEYGWCTLYREPKIRRLETVLYAFGNLKEKLVQWSKKTSYWFEVSTHDGHIHLHTSKSNDEKVEYDVRIDPKNGYLFIKDDIGNYIKLDSVAGIIQMEANSAIRLKAPDIILDTPKVSTTGNIDSLGSHNPAGTCHGAAHPVPAPASISGKATSEPSHIIPNAAESNKKVVKRKK